MGFAAEQYAALQAPNWKNTPEGEYYEKANIALLFYQLGTSINEIRQLKNLPKEAAEQAKKFLDNGEVDRIIQEAQNYANSSNANPQFRKYMERLAQRIGRNGAVKVIDNIRTKILARKNHILKIEMVSKGNGTYRFSGVHSKIAIDDFGEAKARIEIVTHSKNNGVYEAKVFAKGPDGVEYMKSGNGGQSTFFPDNWSEGRILDEVEHAIKYNRGIVPNTTNQYYGFSRDGSVRIDFYYNETKDTINSFFPSLNPY